MTDTAPMTTTFDEDAKRRIKALTAAGDLPGALGVITAALAEAPAGATRPFETLMCVEGRWTGDERIIMVDAMSWDGLLPICLTVDHEGVTEVIGRVDEIARTPGASPDERWIFGKGELFLGNELGQQVADLIDGLFIRGVSIELDAIEEGGVDPADPALDDPTEAGWMMVVESARIRALSVVTTPAFAEAYITFGTLSTEGLPPAVDGPTPLPKEDVPEMPQEDMPMPEDAAVITAAGHVITIPRVPPAEWFDEPTDVSIEGALTVTDEGRIFGLLAPANIPYSAMPGNFVVPMGNVDYGEFHRGEQIVEGGARVVTGNITMGCGHADEGISANGGTVRDHYDNSCSIVAKVRVGERAGSGVWVAGALLPDVTPGQVQRMMGLQLSGHWRPSAKPSHTYELYAALLVPVPGFSMGRRAPSVTMRDGAIAASAIPVQFDECADCLTPSMGDRLSVLEAENAALLARVAALETAAAPLAPLAVEALRARIRGGDPRHPLASVRH